MLIAIKPEVQTTHKVEYLCGCLHEWHSCACSHWQPYPAWLSYIPAEICAQYDTWNRINRIISLSPLKPQIIAETRKHSHRDGNLRHFPYQMKYLTKAMNPTEISSCMFYSMLTPTYTAGLILCNNFQMLKNIIKDLKEYSRWLFFFLICSCDICEQGKFQG